MKRFLGLVLALTGLGGALWGSAHVLTTGATTPLHLTPDWNLPAMGVGLIGVALLTLGFVWLRE